MSHYLALYGERRTISETKQKSWIQIDLNITTMQLKLNIHQIQMIVRGENRNENGKISVRLH